MWTAPDLIISFFDVFLPVAGHIDGVLLGSVQLAAQLLVDPGQFVVGLPVLGQVLVGDL